MSASDDPAAPLQVDFEKALLEGLVKELLRRVSTPDIAAQLSAAEIAQIRALLADNSISFAHIRQGNFGDTAKRVAEEFPFDEEGRVVPIAGRG